MSKSRPLRRLALSTSLVLSIAACGGQGPSADGTGTGGASPEPASTGSPASPVSPASLRTLKAGNPPSQPQPGTALAPDAPSRAAALLLTDPIGEARRIVVRMNEAAGSTPEAPRFESLDLDTLGIAIGIALPALHCIPVVDTCAPGQTRKNLVPVAGQPDAGGLVLELSPAFESLAPTLLTLLRLDPGVASAEPDRRISTTYRPNDPEFGNLWALHDTRNDVLAIGRAGSGRFETAWDRVAEGIVRKAVVAVIDTGLVAHPDVAGPHILPGTDLIGDVAIAADGDGRDADPADPGDGGTCGGTFRPSSWHGTHVTGTIAAIANNGYGVAGAGLDAVSIVPIRVLGRCGGFLSDAADGIRWAAGGSLTAHGQPIQGNANRADVINLSLGASGSCPDYLQRAIDFAVGQGVVVVAAAGNESGDIATATPANCTGVVAVGANDRQGRLATFSNTGAAVALLAPGVAIKSTVDRGTGGPSGPTLAEYDGTSMAAPHVAAAAALLKALDPSVTPAVVKARLQQTASPFVAAASPCTSSTCGAGYLDAAALVATVPVATPSPSPAPTPAPTPAPVPAPASPVVETLVPLPPADVEPIAAEPPMPPTPPVSEAPGGAPPAAALPAGRGGGGSLGLLELALMAAGLLTRLSSRRRPEAG